MYPNVSFANTGSARNKIPDLPTIAEPGEYFTL